MQAANLSGVLVKMPVVCPICRSPMVNSYHPWVDGSQNLVKSCDKTLHHKIRFISLIRDHDEVNKIVIPWTKNMYFQWAFWADNSLKFTFRGTGKMLTLPFFEPDLTNYAKLINKLKTYLIFS